MIMRHDNNQFHAEVGSQASLAWRDLYVKLLRLSGCFLLKQISHSFGLRFAFNTRH
jgi:hypothetical protein